jgi:uncharacterized membrane protein
VKARFLLAGLLAIGASLAAPEASAWMKYCNSTGTTIWTTFGWYSGCTDGSVPWTKKGWWSLNNGECKTVSSLDLSYNRYYYYYAEGADGRVWAGSTSTCVTHNAFDWCWNTCQSPGGSTVGWRQLDTGGSYNNYTLTFNP